MMIQIDMCIYIYIYSTCRMVKTLKDMEVAPHPQNYFSSTCHFRCLKDLEVIPHRPKYFSIYTYIYMYMYHNTLSLLIIVTYCYSWAGPGPGPAPCAGASLRSPRRTPPPRLWGKCYP